MAANNLAVVFDNVSYLYPNATQLALHDLSFSVRRGEFLGIVGPTGAGKTTLCLAVNGIVPHFFGGRFFGRIVVGGLDTIENPVSALSQHVGMVLQDPETQLIATSVENEVAFALENVALPPSEIARRTQRALQAVRLSGLENKHPHELSGGEKQRLAIAAAIAMEPEVLVLDEPTSQLDPIGQREVFSIVRELNDAYGMTVVLVSHAAEQMAEFAERIIVLAHGEIALDGTPDDIYSQSILPEMYRVRVPEVTETLHLIRSQGIVVPRIPVRIEDGCTILEDVARSCSLRPTVQPNEAKKRRDRVIAAHNLWHTYDDGTQALRGVSLDLYAGDYLLVVGQNGAGKTTLVKHFLGLLRPTEGSVEIRGEDVAALNVSDLAREIGYVAQNPDTQIFSQSVEDEVGFALRALRYPRNEIELRIEQSLEAMGLLHKRHAHPLSLPKGDRARVVIAAVLAMQPEVIVLDEPTTGQDYQGARQILDISRSLHEMGKTVVVITHHLYLMAEYAERAIVMGRGTVLLDAPVREAYHAVSILESTFLDPPQSVKLASRLTDRTGVYLPALTPRELAASFVCSEDGGGT